MIVPTIKYNKNIESTSANSSKKIKYCGVNIRDIDEDLAINLASVFSTAADYFILKCDFKTLLSLRKVSKDIYNNIPLDKLFRQFCIENHGCDKNIFSYQAYKSSISPWLNIIAPKYKNKIDNYISKLPKKHFHDKFSECLFTSINILQKTTDLSALKKYKFSLDSNRYSLPSNTRDTALSCCGQYLMLLNSNNEIIISLITAEGLQQINKINYYANNSSVSIVRITSSTNDNIILSTSNKEVHVLKINPIECSFNSKNITIYKPYAENYLSQNRDNSCSAVLSCDEKFLFTLDRENKFKIGSIENNTYEKITEINNVHMFKLNSNNKTLVILATTKTLLYRRNDISNHWELEQELYGYYNSEQVINININDNGNLCFIESGMHEISLLEKTDAKWNKTCISGNLLFGMTCPLIVSDNRVLFSFKEYYGVDSTYSMQIMELKYFIKNLEKIKTFVSDLYSVKYENRNNHVSIHPSKLAAIIVSENNTMEIVMLCKKTPLFGMKNLLTNNLSSFVKNNKIKITTYATVVACANLIFWVIFSLLQVLFYDNNK